MFECHWSGERYGVEIGDFWLGWGLRSGQDETEMTSTVRKSKIEYRNNLIEYYLIEICKTFYFFKC